MLGRRRQSSSAGVPHACCAADNVVNSSSDKGRAGNAANEIDDAARACAVAARAAVSACAELSSRSGRLARQRPPIIQRALAADGTLLIAVLLVKVEALRD